MAKKKIQLRSMDDLPYFWIARIVYEEYAERMGVIGLAIYIAYTSYAFDEQRVFPSQETICRKLGISKPTIIKYNEILEDLGLIKIKRTQHSNHIYLLKIPNPRVKQVYSATNPRVKQVKLQSKRSLLPRVKQVYPNKKNRIKRKEKHTVAKKTGDCGCVVKNLFTGKSDVRINAKDKFNHRMSVQLYDALKSKGKILGKVDTLEWIRQFQKLCGGDNSEKRRVKQVMNWYAKQDFKYRYLPKAYSAKAFREKFTQIEDAMNQSRDPKRKEKKDYKPGDPEDDFPSTETSWITKDGRKRTRVVIDES